VGYIENSPDRYLTGQTNLEEIAAAPDPSSNHLPFWMYYAIEGQGTTGVMDGEYAFNSLWQLTFTVTGAIPDTVTFSGQLSTTFTPDP